MKFDFKQQIKVVVVGAAVAFATKRMGLSNEEAVGIGALAGSGIDIVYFWIVKGLRAVGGASDA